jgi:hypothetical protein
MADVNIDRVFDADFVPTLNDVLRCRLATIGIIKTDFFIDKIKYRMYDVGGQRGERKQW